MSSLAEKLAQVRRQKLEHSKASAAKSEKPDTYKSTELDNLALQVSDQGSKLGQYLQEREDKGLYQLDERVQSIEGLDTNTLIDNLKQLDAAVYEKTPEIKSLSQAIRKNLEQYNELVHLLTDEQLGIMASGYLYTAGVETEPKTAQGKSTARQQKINDLSKLSLDQLF